jgi:hypothetical protein
VRADHALGVCLEVVKHSHDRKGLHVLPRRRVVEDLRLAEPLPAVVPGPRTRTAHAEGFIKIAMIRLMAARLTEQRSRYRDSRPAVTAPPATAQYQHSQADGGAGRIPIWVRTSAMFQ